MTIRLRRSAAAMLAVLVAVAVVAICELRSCHGRIFSFKTHHRFSDQVRRWSELAGVLPPPPEKGSFEYYAQLADRDLLLHGGRRRLSSGSPEDEDEDDNSPLAFADGNSTVKITSLGFLHYTTVRLGTPGTMFMVALDTGSDLFWVPCDCVQCAPTQIPSYDSEFQLTMYDPKVSSTSKMVACNNSLCTHRNRCLETFSSCPYVVSYVSDKTSTSGILVEDVLHLKKEDKHQELVEAFVTFGCGQVQSGSFLDVAAPNGLFGLGMAKISVPSILSREGYIDDSFSMCFGEDGIGRISFGDKGSSDQSETPFNLNPLHPMYNINATQIRVGTDVFDLGFTALFDSGTSFTYLLDPMYKSLAQSFHSQVRDVRHPRNSRTPFEYCYDMSSDANSSLIPTLSLTMEGGSQFVVYDPIIVISTQAGIIYCLAVVKSSEMNIIGQNFMAGYQVVFDREKLILGWEKSDCYDIDDYTSSLEKRNSSNVPPAVAAGLGSDSRPKSTKDLKNNQNSSASPSSLFYTIPLASLGLLILIFQLVFT